jgi:valine--pyruvate aminotransferase
MNKENFSLKTVGAVLLSSPTNPTGNILPEEDLDFLDIQTKKFGIPLLIDLAYGAPFPKITGQSPPVFYKEGRTLSLSFSKVGLPGVRLGIIISSSEIISHLSAFASMGNLAVGNLGIFLAEIFFQEDTLVKLSQNTLRPYYEKKQKTALEMFESEFQKYSVNYEIHEPLGGFFLWVRFPGLSIRNDELYEVCKKKNLYFVSGHFFFPGLNQEFSHTWECIRLTYNVGEEELAHGARLLAEIVAFHQAKS